MEVNTMLGGPKKFISDSWKTFLKYSLLYLNVVFVTFSVIFISVGRSMYQYVLPVSSDMGDVFKMLSLFWFIVGIVFLIVAAYGIFVSVKGDTALANLYGLLMTMVILSQMALAIAAFASMHRSRIMVSDQFGIMMRNEYHSADFRVKVDWIQSKFECCGLDGPSDWQNWAVYWAPHQFDMNPIPTESNRTGLMPPSCCLPYTNYANLTCEFYHSSGCFQTIYQIVSGGVMLTGSLAVFFSVLQIFGVVLGIAYARSIRRNKTQRDVQVWNSGHENLVRPQYARQPDY